MTSTPNVPVWDAHSCLPIAAGVTFSNIDRHRAAGFDFVSINVAMDMTPLDSVMQALAWFRACIRDRPDRYTLAETVADVHAAALAGRLAVAFDIEGARCLLGRPEMVRLYATLGVRQMHLAYNLNNEYAAGCHGEDTGLTPLGREVVRAANRAGVVMDCSHTGRRSSLEIMDLSDRPVVFSHSNVRALADSPRNVRDEQIDACAATGGVIGICGYSRFLGATPAQAEHMVRHIDYVTNRVGIDHVGLGWDLTYPSEGVPLAADAAEFRRYFVDASQSEAEGISGDAAEVPLEERVSIGAQLAALGYTHADIAKVMGGNFLRVATQCWPPGPVAMHRC